LKTRFANVAGLKPGAPVRLAGIEVGSVKTIDLAGSVVEVQFEVAREYAPRITTESWATLGSISLLGQATVDVTPSTEGQPLSEWAYIPSRSVTQLSDVTEAANHGLEEATRLLADIRSGKGTVGRLFTDDSLYREMHRFVDAAQEVAANLSRGRGTAGKLLTDPAAYQALETSLVNLRAITTRINAGEGSLGRLLHDDRFAQSLTRTTTNVQDITEKMSSGQGTAGRLLNDETLYKRLDSVTERLDQLIARLNEGQGTAGQLLHDKALYDNMTAAVSDFRALVANIRKDPRKYLNVKVSVF
jgi:phospholipid/cholesterol/gamma-HCH transport system substrate-binding protein